jgi:hypothetical protein
MEIKHAWIGVAVAEVAVSLIRQLDSEIACTFAGLAGEIERLGLALQSPGGGIRQQRRTAVAPTKGVPLDCCRKPA